MQATVPQPRLTLRVPLGLLGLSSDERRARFAGPSISLGDAALVADDVNGGKELFGAAGVRRAAFVPVERLGSAAAGLLFICAVRAYRACVIGASVHASAQSVRELVGWGC